MDKRIDGPPTGGSGLAVLAWLSPVIPVVATGLFLAVPFVSGRPYQGGFAPGLLVACNAVSLGAAILGLIGGIRSNRVGPVSAAALGMLASVGCGALSLFLWALSGAPRH